MMIAKKTPLVTHTMVIMFQKKKYSYIIDDTYTSKTKD